MSSEPVEMFRCAGCGKWSHARRRPVAHQRVDATRDLNAPGDSTCVHGVAIDGSCPTCPAYDHLVWCGPFVRYVATLDDPSPPTASDRIGQALPDTERFTGEDPNAGIAPAHEVFR